MAFAFLGDMSCVEHNLLVKTYYRLGVGVVSKEDSVKREVESEGE